MAIFNPQVSNQEVRDPNYLGYAKVTDAPPPNQSAALAIDTATKGLDGAISVTDTSIKRGIEDQAYKLIDPERDQMTAALEKVKEQTKVAAPAQTVTGSTTGNSLLDANASMDTPDVPDGVEQGLDRISQLKEAQKAQKINDTQYSGNVLAIAKQLRAQYPGYRDYVDQEISKVSGLPVANAYYQNLITDINRQLAQNTGKADKVESLYLKNLDVPRIQEYWAGYKKGDIPESTFIGKIADWQNLQTQLKVDAAARAEGKDNRDTQIQKTEADFNKNGSNFINLGMKDITTIPGISSPQALIKYFDDVSTGKISASSAEIDQRKSQMASYVQNQERQLYVMAHTPGPDGSTIASVMGEDKVKLNIQNLLMPLKSTLDFAINKDSGPAFFAARQNQAIMDQDKNQFLTNKDTGAAARQMQTVRSILGDTYFPDYIRSLAASGVKDPLADAFNQEALSAISPIVDQRGTPVPRYMVDAYKKGKESAAKAGTNIADTDYMGSVTNLVTKLADPNVSLPAKDQLVDWAFNPKNIGRLNELKMDYRDPNTGETVPGKYRAFNILASPSVVQGVAETAKAHPENYTKFQGTLEAEFGSLFRTDVQTLNKITDKPYLNAHFSWDEKNNSLGLVDKSNQPILRNERAMGVQNPNAIYLNGMLDVVDRINSGIKSLANVQKNNPNGEGDTSSYIFQQLKSMRFNPGDGPITGAPAEVMKSIFKSRNPEATPEQLNDMLLRTKSTDIPFPWPLNFAPEDARSTLQGFLKNPTGTANTNIGLEPQQTRGVIKGNLSDEKLLSIDTQDIPEGMSAREFIQHLKSGKKFGGGVQ